MKTPIDRFTSIRSPLKKGVLLLSLFTILMSSHSLFGQFWVNGRIFIETDTGNPSFTDDGWQTDPGVPNLYITLEKFDGFAWKWENGNEYTSFGNAWEDGIYQFTIQDPGEYRLRIQVFQNFVAVDPWPEWIVQALGDPNNNDVKDHKMLITITTQSPATQVINMPYVEESDQPEAVDDLFIKQDLGIGVPTYSINVRDNDTPATGLTIIGVSRQFEPSTTLEIPGDDFSSDIRVSGGNVSYKPSPSWLNYEGFIFSYTVEDSMGNRDFAKVFLGTETIELTANDDAIFLRTNPVGSEPIISRIAVLHNDIDTDPHLTFQIIDVSPSTQGADIYTDAEFKNIFYTAPAGFTGTDTFTYKILSQGGEEAGPATVTVNIGDFNPPFPTNQNALIRSFMQLFGNSPEAIRLRELVKRHSNEIIFLLKQQESTAPKLFDGFTGPYPGGYSTNTVGTPETESQFLSLIAALEPGIKALLTGDGDNVTITQELIDAVHSLQTLVEASASSELKADIQEVSDMFNNLDDFVGKNFNEAIELLGVDPNASGIVAFDPKLDGGKFSITTYAAADLNFKLWKSSTLQPNSWEEVTNAEVVDDGLYKTLSDPNPGGDRVFYRLTNN